MGGNRKKLYVIGCNANQELKIELNVSEYRG